MPPKQRAKPFSGKQKKVQLQMKKAFKQQNKPSDEVEPAQIITQRIPSETSRAPGSGRINLKSQWEDLEIRKANPRMNPLYQSPIFQLPPESLCISFEDFYGNGEKSLDIPLRPTWDFSMSKEELEENEKRCFKEWIDRIYSRVADKTLISYFEHNLEVWRQLWRVLEFSDVLVLAADIRHPIIHIPPSLCRYILEVLKKPLIIALTKSDLVSKSVRNAWKNYLTLYFPGVSVKFVSIYSCDGSLSDKDSLKKRKRYVKAEGALDLVDEIKKNSVGLEAEWNQVVSNMKSRLEVGDGFNSSDESEDENNSIADELKAEIDSTSNKRWLTIGFVGQPNVGKSSLINSIFGKKVVSASRTPGHTKHFQTLHLSTNIRVSDSPGLIFPAIICKDLQILAGVYNIAQVSDPYGPILFLAERIDLSKILKIQGPDQTGISVIDLCEKYAEKCGFYTSKAARPDIYRAANAILRLVLDGRILLAWLPPDYNFESPDVTDMKHFEEVVSVETSETEVEEDTDEEETEDDDLPGNIGGTFAALLDDTEEEYDE